MIRRFVLLMLLAWLPVQASAMPWLAFRCEQHDSDTQGQAQVQHHAGHAQHAPADAAGHDSGVAGNNVHSCCHHFSGVVHTLPVMAGVEVSEAVATSPPARLHDFIPDLLQRPPLARLV